MSRQYLNHKASSPKTGRKDPSLIPPSLIPPSLIPPGQAATTDSWAAAFDDVIIEASGEIYTAWHSFTVTEQRVAGVIAARSIKLNSTEASRRFGLVKGGKNAAAVQQLEREGHIISTPNTATTWRLVDPLMDMWISNGRSWAV